MCAHTGLLIAFHRLQDPAPDGVPIGDSYNLHSSVYLYFAGPPGQASAMALQDESSANALNLRPSNEQAAASNEQAAAQTGLSVYPEFSTNYWLHCE